MLGGAAGQAPILSVARPSHSDSLSSSSSSAIPTVTIEDEPPVAKVSARRSLASALFSDESDSGGVTAPSDDPGDAGPAYRNATMGGAKNTNAMLSSDSEDEMNVARGGARDLSGSSSDSDDPFRQKSPLRSQPLDLKALMDATSGAKSIGFA